MGKRNGNTVIEALFSLSICFLIINSFMILMSNLCHVHLNNHQDLAYCLYALTEEVSMANRVEIEDDQLILFEGEESYVFELHQQRIVKKPGFNIYLHHVDDLNFYHDGTYVYMNLRRGTKSETFKIGVYFRPSYRVCEPNCTDAISDGIEFSDGFAIDNSDLS